MLRILIVTIGVVFATRADAQASTPTAQTTSSRSARVTYSNQVADFVVGKAVYLKSTKTRIGAIEATDDAHSFPRSFPHSPAKAVLIRRKDGPLGWVPVDGITRIYVVDK